MHAAPIAGKVVQKSPNPSEVCQVFSIFFRLMVKKRRSGGLFLERSACHDSTKNIFFAKNFNAGRAPVAARAKKVGQTARTRGCCGSNRFWTDGPTQQSLAAASRRTELDE
ncbi:hypothetical protein NZK35_00770 [Stieleria sp. ICT_E10.1]|uniref:hypothetical protein n=1 Tax=Stieleria sedimenti TaxID=2976331 RepID=UPI00218029B2|nr:hypothetical protein [Stieleria sedimenti]MCS7465200.1 hypothetical protein [Stieleria sedimenti]